MTAGTEAIEKVSAIRSVIRDFAGQGEQSRRLAPEVVAALKSIGIFRMFVPAELGGCDVDLIAGLETFEELARHDASAGWCAMIWGSAGSFARSMDPSAARKIWADPDTIVSAALAPLGRAAAAPSGFHLTGQWPFASGIDHAAWVGGGCFVYDDDHLRWTDGVPDWRVALIPTADVDVIDTWSVSGLCATGSNDFAVTDHTVDEGFAAPFSSRGTASGLNGFTPSGFLAVIVASVPLGIARRAIDELYELASSKTPLGMVSTLANRASTQFQIAEAELTLRAARSFYYEQVARLHDASADGRVISRKDRALLRLATTNATLSSARVVDLMYSAGGGTSLRLSSDLQRCFRDVHAVTQHLSTAPPTLQLAGQALMDVDADYWLL